MQIKSNTWVFIKDTINTSQNIHESREPTVGSQGRAGGHVWRRCIVDEQAGAAPGGLAERHRPRQLQVERLRGDGRKQGGFLSFLLLLLLELLGLAQLLLAVLGSAAVLAGRRRRRDGGGNGVEVLGVPQAAGEADGSQQGVPNWCQGVHRVEQGEAGRQGFGELILACEGSVDCAAEGVRGRGSERYGMVERERMACGKASRGGCCREGRIRRHVVRHGEWRQWRGE